MTDAQIEIIKVEIAKLCLEPHEVLVVNFPGKVRGDEVAHTAAAIQQLLPNTPVLISSGGVIFSTISQKVLCEECRDKI